MTETKMTPGSALVFLRHMVENHPFAGETEREATEVLSRLIDQHEAAMALLEPWKERAEVHRNYSDYAELYEREECINELRAALTKGDQ